MLIGYRKGDIIGCAFDLVNGDIVFFKNGRCMGIAFTVPKVYYGTKIYPTIATRNAKFQLNFGEKGFVYTPKEFKLEGHATKRIIKKEIDTKGGYLLDINIHSKGVTLSSRKKVIIQKPKLGEATIHPNFLNLEF
jgi:hypothetical protein